MLFLLELLILQCQHINTYTCVCILAFDVKSILLQTKPPPLHWFSLLSNLISSNIVHAKCNVLYIQRRLTDCEESLLMVFILYCSYFESTHEIPQNS